jgi:tetratricopeptide (TPR) repeat protein
MAGCLHQEAVDTLRRALQFYPGDGDLWKCLGEELTELDGPCDDAVDAYRMATVLFPNDIYYWGVLGHAYSRAGRSEEAIAAHRKVIQLAEDCGHKGRIVTAWCDLGHTYMAAHRFREALDAYDTAMKMETQESAPWEGMLRLFLEIGRVEEALALCRLARRLFPDQYVFVYWLKTLETEAAKLHAGPLTSRQKPIAPSDNTCNGGSSRSQKASRPAQGDLFHDDASSEETA